MTEEQLSLAIFQMQKRELDTEIRSSIEEAARLLADGHLIEAEALVQNAEARASYSQTLSASA